MASPSLEMEQADIIDPREKVNEKPSRFPSLIL